MSLKRSYFSISLQGSHSGGFFVFNTLSRKLLHFISPWKTVIKNAQNDIIQKKRLVKAGLLIEAKNYKEEIDNYFHLKEVANRQKITVYFTITTNCDLKCQYCFEGHLKRADTKVGTILKFVSLLDKTLKDKHYIRQLEIILFGGEPLLRIDLCSLLLSKVKEICSNHSVRYKFFLATNGLEINKEQIGRLNRLGVTGVQITFDGCDDFHDKIRNIRGKGSYRYLVEKLPLWDKFFKLILKYNLRKENLRDFGNFVHDIKNLRLKNPTIKLEALQPTLNDCDPCFYFSYNDPKLVDAYFKLASIVRNAGMVCDLSSVFKPPCMVTGENSFMVETDGDISACVSAYKMQALALGNIRKVGYLSFTREDIKKDILKAVANKCAIEKCPYFPLCEAGCFYVKTVQKMNSDVPLCRKRFFRRLFNKYVFELIDYFG